MRTLSFIVDGQIIKQNPECNFSDIVPGSSGYLIAKFKFSNDWDNTIKAAIFQNGENESYPEILKDGSSCIIPSEVLINKQFTISVLGKNEKIKITTNKVKVVQNGG